MHLSAFICTSWHVTALSAQVTLPAFKLGQGTVSFAATRVAPLHPPGTAPKVCGCFAPSWTPPVVPDTEAHLKPCCFLFPTVLCFFHVSERRYFNAVSTNLGNLLPGLLPNGSQPVEGWGFVHFTVKTCSEDYLSRQRWHLPRGYMHGVPKASLGIQQGWLLSQGNSLHLARWGQILAQTQINLGLTRPSHSPAAGTPPPRLSGPNHRRRWSPTDGCERPPPSRHSGVGHSPAAGLPSSLGPSLKPESDNKSWPEIPVQWLATQWTSPCQGVLQGLH